MNSDRKFTQEEINNLISNYEYHLKKIEGKRDRSNYYFRLQLEDGLTRLKMLRDKKVKK